MPLIPNGYAVSICRSFLLAFVPALFLALLSLAFCDPGTVAAQDVKQVKLTEKHVAEFDQLEAQKVVLCILILAHITEV